MAGSTPRVTRHRCKHQQLAAAWLPSPQCLFLHLFPPLPKTRPSLHINLSPALQKGHLSHRARAPGGAEGGGKPRQSGSPSLPPRAQLTLVPPVPSCRLPPLPITFVNSAVLKIPSDACSRKKQCRAIAKDFTHSNH